MNLDRRSNLDIIGKLSSPMVVLTTVLSISAVQAEPMQTGSAPAGSDQLSTNPPIERKLPAGGSQTALQLAPQIARQNAYLAAGSRLFAAKQYQKSELYLREAIRQDPRNPLSHYSLANVLVHLKRKSEAISEYSECYKLDPFGTLSGYCRQALTAYGVPIPDIEPASEPKANATQAKDCSLIEKQMEGARAVRSNYTNAMVKQIIETGELKARAIEGDAKAAAENALHDTPVLISPYTQWVRQNPLISEEARQREYDRIIQEGKERAAFVREQARQKAKEYEDKLSSTTSSLKESAANLDGQLHSKQIKGSAYLKKEGTSLFVRNYGSDPGPIPEVHSGVARITSNKPPLPSEYQAAANLNRLKNQQRLEEEHPDREVKGALLKKHD